MHTIWGKLGYKQDSLKMSFGGRNLGSSPVFYDALRHGYAVNVFAPFADIVDALKKVLSRDTVRYLHGYPSAIHDFACSCEQGDPAFLEQLRRDLRGAFLSSEYPARAYREKVESVFSIPTVSWYGHSERAVLAWERDQPYSYYPFHTYGYCEAVSASHGYHLVGTCYDNDASPFIRYDTGDNMRPIESEDGLLLAFEIEGGREGEFILDKNMKRIPLTGLIFGRHHKLFELARFVQIRQERPGEATLLVTPQGKLRSSVSLSQCFDGAGIEMDFRLEVRTEPIRTTAGKVKLKV